ncbi:MAG: 3D-(3,5/4)-trihydroxycyclohexane-1,2-dione acylhydrolase (decyclizing) [Sporichthyaceae bacterium]
MPRLTVAQALVRFLSVQYSERDGRRRRLIAGCFGIFGHGNVAGVGQALLQAHATGEADLPYWLGRNEQAMVHSAVGYARMSNRLSTLACTTSIGPGATNLVTGAALATINRLPVLLLPGDTFATRRAGTVLQQLEFAGDPGITVNDALRPVSVFFDRVHRPEQLPDALLGAMRVLTDPAATGAVTIALPQDVQAEAYDWPAELFAERTWHVARPVPDPAALARAVATIRGAQRPLLVAGGGVAYSDACAALRAFADATDIPVADTHAGKGALPFDHPAAVGGLGSTGTPAANSLAARADVVIGVGTRWSDFTTGSRTVFADPDVAFVNLNVAAVDAAKHAATTLLADARAGLGALADALGGYRAPAAWVAERSAATTDWIAVSDAARTVDTGNGLPAQTAILGTVNDLLPAHGTVIAAAGSMPGQLQMLWRAGDPREYNVEYGYSCMGYEIAGGLGAKLAAPDREVVVLVGDGSYLMMAQEIATAVSERVKLTVVLVDNSGFASIGALSESLGGQRFGTAYAYRNPATGLLDGEGLPIDLAANAASLGARVLRADTLETFRAAFLEALAAKETTVVHVRTDHVQTAPSSECWWDVPVAEVSALESTARARTRYEQAREAQRPLL